MAAWSRTGQRQTILDGPRARSCRRADREMRMPQPTLGRPLHEPYLRHQLRPHHCISRISSAVTPPPQFGRSTKGQSSTWCGFSALLTSRRRWGTKPALCRRTASPCRRSIRRVEHRSRSTVGTVAADHKLLVVLKLQLLPRITPLSRRFAREIPAVQVQQVEGVKHDLMTCM